MSSKKTIYNLNSLRFLNSRISQIYHGKKYYANKERLSKTDFYRLIISQFKLTICDRSTLLKIQGRDLSVNYISFGKDKLMLLKLLQQILVKLN